MDLAGTIDTEIGGVHSADLTEQLAVTNCSWRFDSPRAQMGSYRGRSDLGGRISQGLADRIDPVFAAKGGNELHN